MVLLPLVIVVESTSSDIVINEVELNPRGEDQGAEWVELYNDGMKPIDISSWTISSTHETIHETITIPVGISIPPMGFYVVSSEKQWLDNDYESVVLKDAVGKLVDQTPYLFDQVDDNCAFTRNPDGGNNWVEMQSSKNAPVSDTTCSCSLSQPDIDFEYSGKTNGSISAIEITPAGRSVKSYHSYLSNIKVGSGQLHERTTALEGHYKYEDSKHFRYKEVELFNETITSPLINWRIRGILSISSWDAHKTIDYSGKEINDRDYSSSLFFKNTSTEFLYNKNFTKDRYFASVKGYSLKANTTGITDLQFGFSDQINRGPSGISDVIIKQRYYGNFNITTRLKENFEYISSNQSVLFITPCGGVLNYTYCSQGWLDDFCGMPLCWDPSYYEIIEV
jgi:hypothetical protein